MTTKNTTPETKEAAYAAFEKACDAYETICANTEAYGKDPETDFDCNRVKAEMLYRRTCYYAFLGT